MPQSEVFPALSGTVVNVLAVLVSPTLRVTLLMVTPETSSVLDPQGLVKVSVKSKSEVAVPLDDRVTLTRKATSPDERLMASELEIETMPRELTEP